MSKCSSIGRNPPTTMAQVAAASDEELSRYRECRWHCTRDEEAEDEEERTIGIIICA